MIGRPEALKLIRRANQLLWSTATPQAVACGALRTFGTSFGAARAVAASPLETIWADQARAAAAFPDIERLRRLVGDGARPYAVIGDSHSRLLVRRSRRADGFWLAPLWWLETGASARGLGRPEARSGAGERVRAAIGQALTIPEAPILLKFGQVDIEFVQVFKRLEAGQTDFRVTDFQAFADDLVGRYVAFAAGSVALEDRGRVRLCSLCPPALSDAAWRKGYVNAHIADLHGPVDGAGLAGRLANLTIPDLVARTALHARVSAALADAALAEGFGVQDDFTPFCGVDGVVDPAYLGPAGGGDHHLDFHATRTPVLDRLWQLLKGSPRQSRSA